MSDGFVSESIVFRNSVIFCIFFSDKMTQSNISPELREPQEYIIFSTRKADTIILIGIPMSCHIES